MDAQPSTVQDLAGLLHCRALSPSEEAAFSWVLEEDENSGVRVKWGGARGRRRGSCRHRFEGKDGAGEARLVARPLQHRAAEGER